MKIILIVANFPPCHLGGFELRAKNIADSFTARGHQIIVVTTRHTRTFSETQEDQPTAYPVIRSLHHRLKPGSLSERLALRRGYRLIGRALTFFREISLDISDAKLLGDLIGDFQPDLIYLSHLMPLSRAIIPFLSGLEIPVLFDDGGALLSDAMENKGIWYKLVDETHRYPIFGKIKPLATWVILKMSAGRLKPQWAWPGKINAIFNNKLNLQTAVEAGVCPDNAVVICSGVDLELFSFKRREKFGSSITLIHPGRLERSKGQVDSIKLADRLIKEGEDVKLLLVGGKGQAAFYDLLLGEIHDLGIQERVTLIPMQGQEGLVRLYHQADVCLFPSNQQLGLSRIPMEAMACGCIVLSYGNEGSRDILRNNETGFLVPEGDVEGMAKLVRELARTPKTVKRITAQAREEVEEHYSLKSYIDRLEEFAIACVNVSQDEMKA